MGKGPLDHPRLLAIEKKLDDGELDEAQHLLAQLGDVAFFRYATTYLATRLLFQRGKLDPHDVADRLRDLLKVVSYFPEASAMLVAAEAGSLGPGGEFKRDATGPSVPSGGGGNRATTPHIELGPTASLPDDVLREPADVVLPSIPRAAPLPQFTPPPDQSQTALRAQEFLDAPDPPAEPEPEPRQPATPAPRPPYQRRLTPEELFIRSGPPPAIEEAAPRTLFEIAALLDAGEAELALTELDRISEGGAEVALMRARALATLGREGDALAVLGRLAAAPLLDPELRAGVARLLIELGRHDEALTQARKAHGDDPEPVMVRVTLAWAAVRALRFGGDPRLTELAQSLVQKLKSRSGPRPALVFALRAALISGSGDAERAVALAARALKLDPRSSDALSALALASARLGRTHDARQAWIRLLDVDRNQAAALVEELGKHGVDVAHIDPGERPGQSLTGDDTVWESLEQALIEGRRRHVVVSIEELCRDALTNIAGDRESELYAIASVAASFFSAAPVFRDFAPYDLSLWSIARIDAALAVLYGGEPRPKLESDDYAILVLTGAYVGEALRQAHSGKWHGGLTQLDAARVSANAGEWRPFRMAKARIKNASPLMGDETLSAMLAHPGSDPWSYRLPCPVAPPTPWDPGDYPEPSRIDVLGRALSRSVIGVWCERFAEGPLDRSLASLAALDSYLSLVAPTRAPRPADEPWLRRVAILAGAYLGEVLRSAAGGEWVRSEDDALGPDSYHVIIGADVEAAPVAQALARLAEHGIPLMEYATRLARGLAHG